MAFEYYHIEEEVVEVLSQGFTESSLNIAVIQQPDDDNTVLKGVTRSAVVISLLQAAVPEQPQSTNEHSYQEVVTILISIQARSLRNSTGCHTIATLIKKYLIGYQPQHCGRIGFKSYQPADPAYTEDALWNWMMELTIIKVTAQEIDDEPAGADFKTFTINEAIPCDA